MKRFAALALLFAAISAPSPAHEIDRDGLTVAAEEAGFDGTLLVARGDEILFERAFGTVAPDGDAPHELGQVWRWHSISKQIAATIAMMAVAEGRLDIDAPIARYLPDTRQPFADRLTTAQLMQHLSGLRHADDGPFADNGYPRFYIVAPDSEETGVSFCEGPTEVEPGETFRYGDCDYVMVAAILEAIYGKPYAEILDEKILTPLGMTNAGLARDAAIGVEGYENGEPERKLRLGAASAAAANYGTAHDLLKFSRALMSGSLIPSDLRERMWLGDGRYGFAALGQWAYEAPVAGCERPLRIIERRGAGMGTQARNIILPDQDMVIIAFTNRSEADFNFGEVWTGDAFTLDLLEAAACR
ncbi:serine hydrolase [Altererythrobacter aurantiacus]|uniref:Serine hydrolase n=1 Tax=Parapontixanthobacter aurantiacus TaxID=1463599 RepID=A0A844ZCH7_9SPHN|nr:serine hydrolase [Parapontixanthobacter aurantiacus]